MSNHHRCYVTKNRNQQGSHEVHRAGCYRLPLDHRVYLGEFYEGRGAAQIAKNYYLQVTDCSACAAKQLPLTPQKPLDSPSYFDKDTVIVWRWLCSLLSM